MRRWRGGEADIALGRNRARPRPIGELDRRAPAHQSKSVNYKAREISRRVKPVK